MNPDFIPLGDVIGRSFDLDSIRIARPCRADWDAMSGDDRARHCKACAKNVYNLSDLTRAEATRLVREKEGHGCVRFFRRADGTILTSDCSVGISRLQKPRRALQTIFAATIAAILTVLGVSSARASRQSEAPLMGAPAPLMGEIAPPQVPTKPVTPKVAPKAIKTHANRNAKPARPPKSAPQHRRHRSKSRGRRAS